MSNQAVNLTDRTIPVVINNYAGSSQMMDDLSAAFCAANLSADIHRPKPKHLSRLLHQLCADAPPMIVVGGGDGTLSAAANALVDTDIILGILPLGTFNHFAKDLGLPLMLNEAVQTLTNGRVHRVDVGDVNGRVFINNASLGIYPYAVQQREQHQEKLGIRKLPAMIYAMFKALWRLPTLKTVLSVDNERHIIKTPFLFLGNNRYQPELLSDSHRDSLSEGVLSVFYSPQPTRKALVSIAFHTALGRVKQAPALKVIWTSKIELIPRKKRLKLGIDGELMQLRAPLRVYVRQQALQVIVPSNNSV